MTTIQRKYGFKKSGHMTLTGPNINLGFSSPSELKALVDLRPEMPGIYDQEQEGSCVANSLSGGVEFVKGDNVVPSRQFLYYNCREIDGTVNQDSGSTITTGIHALNSIGICAETLWPYTMDDMYVKPTPNCYAEAKKELLTGYSQLPTGEAVIVELQKSLSAGYPVAFGMQLFSYMESSHMARTGVLHMPDTYTEQYLGGHALLIVGIDMNKEQVIIRNSWGKDWGQDGYFTAPFEYISTQQLASDFWSIHKMN
jgi:C1A family cysteine protease